MTEFLDAYWWVPLVSVGLTEWFYALFPKLNGRPRDIILPAVALIVVVMSVYLPRLLPENELNDLANAFILWSSTTGIVRWVKRTATDAAPLVFVDGVDKTQQ